MKMALQNSTSTKATTTTKHTTTSADLVFRQQGKTNKPTIISALLFWGYGSWRRNDVTKPSKRKTICCSIPQREHCLPLVTSSRTSGAKSPFHKMVALRLGSFLGTPTILSRLSAARNDVDLDFISFVDVHFSMDVVRCLGVILDSRRGQFSSSTSSSSTLHLSTALSVPLKRIHMSRCTGLVDLVISKIMSSDAVLDFVFYDWSIDDSVAHSLATGLKGNQSLRQIRLDGINLVAHQAEVLSEGLALNRNLRDVCFWNTTFDEPAIGALAIKLGINTTTCHSLNHQQRQNSNAASADTNKCNQSSDTDADAGSDASSDYDSGGRGIQLLSFKGCALSDRTIFALVTALQHDHSTLQTLDLMDNRCRSQGVRALSTFLSLGHNSYNSTTQLIDLNLSCQHFSRQEAEEFDIALLAESLRHNKTLQNLRLYGNSLTSLHLNAFGPILCENNTLQLLDFGNNCVEDIAFFGSYLGRMKGLKSLDLGANRVTMTGGKQLLRALEEENFELEEFIGPPSDMLPDLDPKLGRHWLDLNHIGRRLMHARGRSNLPDALWPILLGRVNKIFPRRDQVSRQANAIYFVLHNGPALLEQAYKGKRKHSQIDGVVSDGLSDAGGVEGMVERPFKKVMPSFP